MVSSVLTHKFSMISSLITTRFVVQFSSHQECNAEKFDKAFAGCVSFTCFIRLYSVLLLTIKISQSARESSIRSVVVKIQFEPAGRKNR